MKSATAPSALLAVTADGTPGIHLVASGPALAGTHPDRLPPSTLCGAPALGRRAELGAGDTDCSRCLERSAAFMALPGWSPWQ